jgi:glycine/D-amino acid oxidase-like deaminating enzyme
MARIDATVRGAGIMGLACAFVLARRGARIRVIDPHGIGAGASGGLVGALSPHMPENWDAAKEAQFQSLLLAPAFWASVRDIGGEDPGYARTGRLMPLEGGKAVETAHRRTASAQTHWRGEAQWLVEPAAPGWGPVSPSGLRVRDTLAARVAPRRALSALAAALRALGTEITQDAPEEGPVIDATGAALPPMTGVKGQAALLHLPGHETQPQIYAGGLYIVPHADGTVAVGSTAEKTWTHPTETDSLLDHVLARARALVPALAEAPVLERWAALRPRAPSGHLLLGPDPSRPGRILANGGFRTGFGMAPLAADLIADLVLDNRDRIPPEFRPPPA